MIKGNLKGVFAAALTPLKADLTPDDQKLVGHGRWLLANGCDGLAILGTTGEANSFCLKERIRIIETMVEAGIPGSVLMPGTGCCSITDAVTLTQVAVRAGAGGVLMLPPFYYKNVSDQGLCDFFSNVIQQVGDARLKIYLYHFPQMSATPVSMNLIEMLVKKYPDTVVGMKDSSGDFENMKAAAKNFPGFAVFPGADDLLLPMLKEGGAGCITACANVASKQAGEVWRAFHAKKDATAAHQELVAVRKAYQKHPLSAALKATMADITGDDTWLTVRPPLVTLDKAKQKQLFDELKEIGFALPKAA